MSNEQDMLIWKLQKIADRNGLKITELLDSVLAAKERLLGDKWIYCPCDPENKSRYCGSKLCLNDIKRDGICHCGLFKEVNNWKDSLIYREE